MLARVVVGFDGSPGSQAALVWAAYEVRLHTATLVALTVEDTPARDGQIPSQDLPADLAESAHSVVGNYPMEFRREHGPPAERLIGVCRPGDLLVVGNEATTRATTRSQTCRWTR